MSESAIQAITNGGVGLLFLVLAYEYLHLFTVVKGRTSLLATAMQKKYIACTIAFVFLAALQVYSVTFNILGEVGIFTLPVRTALRVLALVSMIGVAYWARRMRLEIDRAEGGLNKEGE